MSHKPKFRISADGLNFSTFLLILLLILSKIVLVSRRPLIDISWRINNEITPIYRVRISSRISSWTSSWIFELDFSWSFGWNCLRLDLQKSTNTFLGLMVKIVSPVSSVFFFFVARQNEGPSHTNYDRDRRP